MRKVFIIFLLGIFLISLASAFDWADDIKAYYALDETSGTVLDLTGNLYNGTNNGATRGTAGKINNSFTFDGVNDYVNISNYYSFGGADPNSFSIWIYPNQTQSKWFFTLGTNAPSSGGISIKTNGDDSMAYYYDGGTYVENLANSILTPESWNHVVTTYDGAGDLKVYVNGISTDNKTLSNVTFPSASNDARIGAGYAATNSYFNGSIDELGVWNRTLSDTEVLELYNGGSGLAYNPTECFIQYNYTNQSISCGATLPTVNYPTGLIDYGRLGEIIKVNYTTESSNYLVNITLTDQSNLTMYIINDSGNFSQLYDWEYKVFENSRTHNTTSYETAYEDYKINVTANSSLTAVKLDYNGTAYSMTNQGSGVWSYSRDLPSSVIGNNSIKFNFTYSGDIIVSNYTTYQDVQAIFFGLCNGTYTEDFLNISFKDEAGLSYINASISNSIFSYYLGQGTELKVYNLINNTANDYYTFCASPSSRTFNVQPYIQYLSSGYPQRIWQPSIIQYTNSIIQQILYLLSTEDGIYVTFQVLGASSDPLQGVEVTAERDIGGSDTIVGQGTTDAAGAITMWLNPDFEHTFTFVKTGYDNYTTSLFPTQSTYTISLGANETGNNDNQYYRGIGVIIQPLGDFLDKNTEYSFNYTISTNYWTLDGWGFTLKYGNGTEIGTQTSTDDTGGTLSLTADTLNETKIIMDYYYIVNSSQINGTRFWLTQQESDFSIWYFFTDLSTYISQDLFGILSDDEGVFGKALISVIILVGLTGILGFRYGIASESAIMGIIFGIVLGLNTLGFIPNPDFLTASAVTLGDFLVFICLLIMISFIFKEESR